MCDAYSNAEGGTEGWGRSTGKCWGHTTSTGRAESISIGTPIESFSLGLSGRSVSAQSSPRVKNAAEGLEREIRLLAMRLTVAEFHAVRVRLEDVFDDVLLNHLP